MTELLVLAILLEGNYTIYKIKQKIKNNFSIFSSASFGAIHPAVKKLEKDGFISAKRKMSIGGQKSSTYSITNKGKDYFKELMLSEISESPLYSNQLSGIKIMLLDLLDEKLRKDTINSIQKHYEIHLLNLEDLLESLKNQRVKDKEKYFFRTKFLQHYADKISREISWIREIN